MACPFDLSPTTLSPATVDVPYSDDIVASNGVAPYTFSNIRSIGPLLDGIPYDTLIRGLTATYIAPDTLRLSGTPIPWNIQASSQDTSNPALSIWNNNVLGTDKFTFTGRILSSCGFAFPTSPFFEPNGVPADPQQLNIIRIEADNPGVSVFVVVQGDRTNGIGFQGRIWNNTQSGGAYNTNDGGSETIGAGTFYDNINDETFIQWPEDNGTQAIGDGVFYYYTTLAAGSAPLPIFGIGDTSAYIENLLNTSLRAEWVSRIEFKVYDTADPGTWAMPLIVLEAKGGAPAFWCEGPFTIQWRVFNAFGGVSTSTTSVSGPTTTVTFDASDDDGCNIISSQVTIPWIANSLGHIILPLSTTLPNGIKGKFYNITFSTSGGTAPYTYLVFSGSLPQNLSLDTDGTLSGTPIQLGTFTFTIQSRDANDITCDCKTYTLTIGKRRIRKPPIGLPSPLYCIPKGDTDPSPAVIVNGNLYINPILYVDVYCYTLKLNK